MLSRIGRLLAVAGLIFFVAVVSSQCSKPTPQAPASAPNPSPQGNAQGLIGAMNITPVVSVKELMQYMIDPISDNIFDAIYFDSSEKGIVDHQPRTDEDWDKIKIGAVTIAEGIFLLKVPRPFTPPGDVNNSTGPNPPELSPTQIKEKVDQDPVLWEAKIQALRNVTLEILEIANKKDVKALFAATGDLDEACEACHLEYWYPGDKAAVEEWKKSRVTYDKPTQPRTPVKK